jgi:orotidine-5'-phosphate decarboxylase
MKNAMDKLIDKIKEMDNPTVMGLDPRYDMIPKCITSKYEQTIDGACKAIIEFNKALIDATYDIIPAVKPQIAFYEMFGVEGIKAFKETCDYASKKGMLVIADIKRGDIGSTAAGYSNAYLGATPLLDKEEAIFNVDFITVNPYLGVDGIKPFVDDCKKYGKGMFIIDKTSNPSSGELQDLKLENGRTIYEEVALLIEKWGEESIGEYGYSSVSSVVGATYPEQLQTLRKLAPHTFFLIPGYGAQGGKASDIALGFDKNGIGGIVNASRSLMCAYKKSEQFAEEEFASATRAEAIRMRDELNQAIKNK